VPEFRKTANAMNLMLEDRVIAESKAQRYLTAGWAMPEMLELKC
jgi:hypothetical protein